MDRVATEEKAVERRFKVGDRVNCVVGEIGLYPSDGPFTVTGYGPAPYSLHDGETMVLLRADSRATPGNYAREHMLELIDSGGTHSAPPTPRAHKFAIGDKVRVGKNENYALEGEYTVTALTYDQGQTHGPTGYDRNIPDGDPLYTGKGASGAVKGRTMYLYESIMSAVQRTHKFKIGDRVLSNGGMMERPGEYTITHVREGTHNDPEYVGTRDENKSQNWYLREDQSGLTLIPPKPKTPAAPFKVGDVVRVKKSRMKTTAEVLHNKRLRVTSIEPDTQFGWGLTFEGHGGGWIVDRFRLAKRQ